KTLREDAHAAVRKMSPYGDQRRRAKSAGLPSGMRGWGSRSPLADFVPLAAIQRLRLQEDFVLLFSLLFFTLLHQNSVSLKMLQ
ncbi:hypothetical protein, partial [[Clostridium] aminophilum]|uniref:hypothetical protein n=1 Tax=[Clostridium] aminophilum TaxID=1526 RepID=UPI003325668A